MKKINHSFFILLKPEKFIVKIFNYKIQQSNLLSHIDLP